MQVVGIDITAERLEVAREKYSANNIEYLEGNAEDIPRVSGIDSYDYIFSNFVLPWCRDKEKVFKEVHRVLKKGGKFAFSAGTCADPEDPVSLFASPEYLAAMKETYLEVPLDEYIKYAAALDLETVYTKAGSHEWKFPGSQEYIDYLRMHMHGDFGMSHFNIDAVKQHFGEGEVTISMPFALAIVKKI